MEIADELCEVLPYMATVDECREALQILSQQWDLLDVLSRVIETGTEVQRTRSEFRALNSDLIAALADESLKKVVSVLAAKSQVTVDVIIRNLFERTADIGFLATDDDLRDFVAGGEKFTASDVRERLLEYQAKYSVYNNIVVLDTQGKIVASVCDKGLPEESRDPLVRQALETSEAYVETFAPSDLCPSDEPCLSYAFRITETNSPTSKSLGVLVLMFGFEDEMDGIFGKLNDADDWSVLTLLDEHGTVLASADATEIGVGAQLNVDPSKEYQIIRHAGRRYIAVTRDTKGYQGFYGLGWRGCALMSVECAFEQGTDMSGAKLEDHQFALIARNEDLLSDAMREIPRRANEIQAELNRTVWNGHLVQSPKGTAEGGLANHDVARQTLLSEISATGERTSQIFGDAVSSLNKTAVGLILEDCAFASSLAVDLMDRNLYERANDCRWWALTTKFREILAQGTQDDKDKRDLTEILKYINGLYTVYTNLILFDEQGTVLAVSNAEESDLVGSTIDPELRGRITRIPRTSYYGVSDFEATSLYDDRPTYVYGAPIHHPKQQTRIIGGIAIVFDGEPEFREMLTDASPHGEGGSIKKGCKALFLDGQRNIISSTDSDDIVGTQFNLPEALFSIAPGEQNSTVIVRDGDLLGVGVSRSAGYREYKSTSDEYENTVFAVCILKLATASEAVLDADFNVRRPKFGPVSRDTAELVELATFRIGASWYALPTASILKSVLPEQIAELPHTGDRIQGCILHQGKSVLLVNLHDVLAKGYPKSEGRTAPVVLFRTADGTVTGLEVDTLGEIVTVGADQLFDVNKTTDHSVAVSIVSGQSSTQEEAEGSDMLLVLDGARILEAAGVTATERNVA